MNKTILMGRLTRDPEVRYSQTAEPVARKLLRSGCSQKWRNDMGYIKVLEEKTIEERCSNCLYCGSNGVTCANANNDGKPMLLVNGGRACRWYWLNQHKFRRA